MIDLKTAVSATHDYLISIQDIIGSLEDLRLEEVELSEDRKYWLITLGFDIPVKAQSPINPLFSQKSERKYKLFKVNTENGAVEAMKIREV